MASKWIYFFSKDKTDGNKDQKDLRDQKEERKKRNQNLRVNITFQRMLI